MKTSVFKVDNLASAEQVIPFAHYKSKDSILVQVFCGLGCELLQDIGRIFEQNLPQAICIGATTDGEISHSDVSTLSCVISITHFAATTLHRHAAAHKPSYETGCDIAKSITSHQTKLLIILSDGTTTNGDELVQGIYAHAPNVTIAGGMAGDNATFTQTYILNGSELIDSGAVAVAMDSEQLQVRNHYSFDWQPIGKKLLITHSENNRVFTINNKPAAEIYAHYLGHEIATKMPATGIEFPLVMDKNGVKIARAVLAIHDDGSLSFAGNIPQESEVQFGFGNMASIIHKSVSSSEAICNDNIETFFIYSCMARRRYMPENISVEIAPFDRCAETAGFFTYGEFFHTAHANALMNQTLTAVALSESESSIFEKSNPAPGIESVNNSMVQTFNALSNLVKVSTDELNETFQLFDSGQFILFKWRNEAEFPAEYVSNNVASILGYNAQSFQQNDINLMSLIHRNDLDRVIREREQAIYGNGYDQYVHEPYRVKKHDGEYLWIYETTRLVRNEQSEVTHVVGYLTDISTRKKAEEKLRLFASIFHSSAEAIIVINNNNQVISVNPACCHLTGYAENELLGSNPIFLLSKRHNRFIHKEIIEHINTTGSWQGEVWNRKKGGEIYAVRLSISTIFGRNKRAKNYILLFSDITEVKAVNERVEFLAHHDALTGLPNRILFESQMQHAILQAKRNDEKVALLFIDIDHFKSVNDSLGHRVGDLLIKQFVKRLQQTLRQNDTISRQGGDEFLIMINEIHDEKPVLNIINKISAILKPPFSIDDHQIHASSSIGIAIYPDNGEAFDTLLQHADTAMYHAKNSGRDTYHFFTSEMHDHAIHRHSIQNRLHEAIPNNEFYLEFQPQYDIQSNSIIGAEALLRWNSKSLGEIPPSAFIPIAEESGQIIDIGNWVFEEACRALQEIRSSGHKKFTMSVNISALQFKQAHFLSHLLSIAQHYNVSPCFIEIELTESILISNIQHNLDLLNQIKSSGFKLAIDDFGTGYSSLSYLKQFPADTLKIDRSFISDINDDENDISIVDAIIGLGHTYGLKVVAEGVETNKQYDHLQQQACDIIQGYFYCKPLKYPPLKTMLAKLQAGHPII
jgi:diguanylate cyclase (GGDEF)-like protein/PAS domain S-box-containing protein